MVVWCAPGEGTARPPLIRISILEIQKGGAEEVLATCETHVGTAPKGEP